MSYLGRFKQGTEVPISVRTVDGSGVAVVPAFVPFAEILGAGGKIDTFELPVKDKAVTTGLFQFGLFLDSNYPVGQYSVIYRYRANSLDRLLEDAFEVIEGGNVAGSVNSTFWWDRPEASYIVFERDDGKIEQGRNPFIVNSEGEFG